MSILKPRLGGRSHPWLPGTRLWPTEAQSNQRATRDPVRAGWAESHLSDKSANFAFFFHLITSSLNTTTPKCAPLPSSSPPPWVSLARLCTLTPAASASASHILVPRQDWLKNCEDECNPIADWALGCRTDTVGCMDQCTSELLQQADKCGDCVTEKNPDFANTVQQYVGMSKQMCGNEGVTAEGDGSGESAAPSASASPAGEASASASAASASASEVVSSASAQASEASKTSASAAAVSSSAAAAAPSSDSGAGALGVSAAAVAAAVFAAVF